MPAWLDCREASKCNPNRTIRSWETHMGNLTIRNLNDAVIERLKAQARANERSLEGEVRHLLTREVARPLGTVDFLARADSLAATTTHRKQTDSTALVREDRDR